LFIARKYFDQILAFTQCALQPSFSNKFILDYALNRFIFLREGIESYIYDHQSLGAHTNVVILGSRSASNLPEAKFLFWSHDGKRPLGNHCPQQCPHCFALRPWKPRSLKNKVEVEHRCKSCSKIFTYNPTPGATQITPPGPKSVGGERGTWWMRTSTYDSQEPHSVSAHIHPPFSFLTILSPYFIKS
jgi:hypothetical protein